MFNYKKIQINTNKLIAEKNKKFILQILMDYYIAVYSYMPQKAKEYAITLFWEAKKQGRLDNLNRITK